MVEEILKKAIVKASGADITDVVLETPANPEHGDFSTNIALQLFGKKVKILKQVQDDNVDSKSPRELAESIKEKLSKDDSLYTFITKDINIAGPGFINFFLNKNYLVQNMKQVISGGENFGKSGDNNGRKVMVEFAHPNTLKAFHIGHLRNITTGESIVRLLEAVGFEVVRANYQGDVGMHIAKALWGFMHTDDEDPETVSGRAEFLGRVYAKGATAYEESDESKTEIQEINKKIYSKEDEKINEIYQKTRQWSLDYFESIYKRVYSHFDRFYFESECYESGKEYAFEALEKGIFEKSDGAIIFPGSKYDLHDRVFISGEGIPTYEAKDLGLVKLQIKEYNPNLIIHVLGPEQLGYTSVIFKAQELLFPETKGKQLHIPYGWVKLKEGKMSSRTGKVVLGETLLNEAKEKISEDYKSTDEVAEKIAVGAVKYSFLKVARDQEISFDLKESISLEGNSGPYVQYTYARAKSVLKKGGYRHSEFSSESEGDEILRYTQDDKGIEDGTTKTPQLTSEEESLMRAFVHFPGVIINASKNYSPSTLCTYLFDVAQKYNTFYNKCKIVGSENERFRLELTAATAQILANGLAILGISAPEKM